MTEEIKRTTFSFTIDLGWLVIIISILVFVYGIPIKTNEFTTGSTNIPAYMIDNPICGKTITIGARRDFIFDGQSVMNIEINDFNISDDIDLSEIKFGETKVKLFYHENLVTGRCHKSHYFIDKIEEVK
jgi:hypothetical protein